MSGLNEVSKKSGVNQEVLATVFAEIVKMVASGETVKIHGFGTFKRRLFAGRTLKTPLLTKAVKYGDSYVLKFHQSALAKQQLNAMAKGEEPPPKKKPGPQAKPAKVAPAEADDTEEVEVPAKPAKKVAAKKEPKEEAEAPAKPTKKAAAAPALTPKKKAAPPPPVDDEEDEEDESEEEEAEDDDDGDED